jgi:hypothetical protein
MAQNANEMPAKVPPNVDEFQGRQNDPKTITDDDLLSPSCPEKKKKKAKRMFPL